MSPFIVILFALVLYYLLVANRDHLYGKAGEHTGMMKPYLREITVNYPYKYVFRKRSVADEILSQMETERKRVNLYLNQHELFSHKKNLAKTANRYKVNGKIMPETYILPEQYNSYRERFKGVKTILKTDSERQEGIFVTTEIQPEHFIYGEKFIVAQRYLNSCLTYLGYRLAFRIWMVLHLNQNCAEAFCYPDGLVYYSAGDKNISSFYDSKTLYRQGYPVTIGELDRAFNIDLLPIVIAPVEKLATILKEELVKNRTVADVNNYELFGVDVHVEDSPSLNSYILEVNNGPGMKPLEREIQRYGTICYATTPI